MHAQQQARLFGDGVFIVGQARAVGGADFAQDSAGFGHHVRHAERSADFHQLSARDDDLAAFSQRVQGQHHRRGAVIDDDGPNAADAILIEQPREQSFNVDIALAALAGGDIKFKIGVAARNFSDALDSRFGQRRTPKICMQNHARGVDDRLE